MYTKSNLVYVAEDHGITDFDGFIDYCFANYPKYVWSAGPGDSRIDYCHPNDASFLAGEYMEFSVLVDKRIRRANS